MSGLGLRKASKIALLPSSSEVFRYAPASMRALVIRASGLFPAASCSGVMSQSVKVLTSAPASRRARTTS